MKKILMAAAAVTALTAGSASAASIREAKVSGVSVVATSGTTTTVTSYKIASEAKYGTGLNSTTASADNYVILKVDAGRRDGGAAGRDYTVVFTYAGPVGFQVPLDATSTYFATNAGSGCSPTSALLDGGLKGGKTVTYTVTLPSACNSTQGVDEFTLKAPLTATGTGDVTVTGKISTGGATIDNGEATARTLIKNAAGFEFTTAADATATNWLLAGTTPYTTLTTDNTLGTYTLKAVTTDTQGPFVTLAAGSDDKVDSANLNLTADVSISGDVSSTTLTVGGTAATKNTAKDTSTRTGIAKDGAARTVTIAVDADVKTSQPSRTYTMTVTPATTAVTFTAPAAKTQVLQTVGLEGTNLNVPWVAGNQSPSSTVLRIANNGTTATGAVTVMIKSPVRNTGTTAGATTCTSSAVPALAKIGAGEELVLGTTELTTCFGDFKRGDLIVTIQAAKTNLTAKARLTTASGQISETSIGGLEQFGAY
jgi:hypothetical protein